MQTSSLEDKVRLLKTFADNPWFGAFVQAMRQHEKDALIFCLNIDMKDLDAFFKREQAFGEIHGCKHFLQDYFDTVDELLELVAVKNNTKDKNDRTK